MLLPTRIQDFEKRRADALDDADRTAISCCLLTLLDHAEPLVPHVARS